MSYYPAIPARFRFYGRINRALIPVGRKIAEDLSQSMSYSSLPTGRAEKRLYDGTRIIAFIRHGLTFVEIYTVPLQSRACDCFPCFSKAVIIEETAIPDLTCGSVDNKYEYTVAICDGSDFDTQYENVRPVDYRRYSVNDNVVVGTNIKLYDCMFEDTAVPLTDIFIAPIDIV